MRPTLSNLLAFTSLAIPFAAQTIAISSAFAATPFGQADLSVSAAFRSGSVMSGHRIVLDTTVQNAGPGPASSLELRISPFSPFDEPEVNAPGWSCTGMATGNPTITCVRPGLAAGESRRIELSVRPRGGAGVLELEARVQSSSTDPTLSNNTAFVRVPIVVRADLSAAISVDPAEVGPGGLVLVRVDVTNRGPSDVGLTDATVLLPSGARLIRMVPNGSRWFCAVRSFAQPELVGCATRQALYSGAADVPILLEVTAPSQPGDHGVSFLLTDVGGSDPGESNNSASTILRVSGSNSAEKLLLPIVITEPVPGAFGSLFSTELVLRNSSPFTIEVTQRRQDGCNNCTRIPSAASVILRPDIARQGQGVFVYVSGGSVAGNLRVQDISRQALTWGTELPIVRRSDVSADSLEIVNVPTDGRFRQALRVYNYDGNFAARVRIRITDLSNVRVLADSVMSLQPNAASPDSSDFPAMLELTSLTTSFREITQAERINIEVTSLDGVPIWAFASVTNNETQHITTITPQK